MSNIVGAGLSGTTSGNLAVAYVAVEGAAAGAVLGAVVGALAKGSERGLGVGGLIGAILGGAFGTFVGYEAKQSINRAAAQTGGT